MIAVDSIIKLLPYSSNFRFVDEISFADDASIIGHFTFVKENPVYQGHFKNVPVVPGIIAIEAMGQAGLIAHAIYLTDGRLDFYPVLHDISAQFYKKIPFEKKMTIIGELVYFRFSTVKSKIKMMDENGEVYVTLTGLLKLISNL